MTVRHVALAVFVALLWGFNFIVIKFGLDSFPPLLFSALRFLCAAIPAVFFIERRSIPWRLILQVGVVLGVVKYSLLYLGIKAGMPAGLSSLVLQAQVPFTVIISALMLAERPSRLQQAGIVIALGGIAVIAHARAGGVTLAGVVMVVGAAVAWSGANVLIKRAGGAEPFRLMVWMSLVPPLPLLVLSLLTEHNHWAAIQHMGLRGAGTIVYTGLVATVLAFGIWGRLLHQHAAGAVTPFALLVPVFGMAFSSLILGEALTPSGLLAAALVLLGLAVVVIGPRLGASFALRRTQVTAR